MVEDKPVKDVECLCDDTKLLKVVQTKHTEACYADKGVQHGSCERARKVFASTSSSGNCFCAVTERKKRYGPSVCAKLEKPFAGYFMVSQMDGKCPCFNYQPVPYQGVGPDDLWNLQFDKWYAKNGPRGNDDISRKRKMYERACRRQYLPQSKQYPRYCPQCYIEPRFSSPPRRKRHLWKMPCRNLFKICKKTPPPDHNHLMALQRLYDTPCESIQSFDTFPAVKKNVCCSESSVNSNKVCGCGKAHYSKQPGRVVKDEKNAKGEKPKLQQHEKSFSSSLSENDCTCKIEKRKVCPCKNHDVYYITKRVVRARLDDDVCKCKCRHHACKKQVCSCCTCEKKTTLPCCTCNNKCSLCCKTRCGTDVCNEYELVPVRKHHNPCCQCLSDRKIEPVCCTCPQRTEVVQDPCCVCTLRMIKNICCTCLAKTECHCFNNRNEINDKPTGCKNFLSYFTNGVCESPVSGKAYALTGGKPELLTKNAGTSPFANRLNDMSAYTLLKSFKSYNENKSYSDEHRLLLQAVCEALMNGRKSRTEAGATRFSDVKDKKISQSMVNFYDPEGMYVEGHPYIYNKEQRSVSEPYVHNSPGMTNYGEDVNVLFDTELSAVTYPSYRYPLGQGSQSGGRSEEEQQRAQKPTSESVGNKSPAAVQSPCVAPALAGKHSAAVLPTIRSPVAPLYQGGQTVPPPQHFDEPTVQGIQLSKPSEAKQLTPIFNHTYDMDDYSIQILEPISPLSSPNQEKTELAFEESKESDVDMRTSPTSRSTILKTSVQKKSSQFSKPRVSISELTDCNRPEISYADVIRANPDVYFSHVRSRNPFRNNPFMPDIVASYDVKYISNNLAYLSSTISNIDSLLAAIQKKQNVGEDSRCVDAETMFKESRSFSQQHGDNNSFSQQFQTTAFEDASCQRIPETQSFAQQFAENNTFGQQFQTVSFENVGSGNDKLQKTKWSNVLFKKK